MQHIRCNSKASERKDKGSVAHTEQHTPFARCQLLAQRASGIQAQGVDELHIKRVMGYWWVSVLNEWMCVLWAFRLRVWMNCVTHMSGFLF